MPFFTQSELNSVRNDPDAISDLYAAKRGQFVATLDPAFADVPDDYIALAFTSLFSYELTPYGDGPTTNINDLNNLLNQSTMMCANYCNLAWLLYELLPTSGDAVVTQIGWNRSVITNHAQLLIGLPGEETLLLDPTIGLMAVTGGFNELTAGVRIPPSDIQSFFFRQDPGIPGFNNNVISALTDGMLRGGNLFYWYSSPEYIERYAGTLWNPVPQRENLLLGSGGTNDLSLSSLEIPNQQEASTGAPWLFGTAGSDYLQATTKSTVIFGGASTFTGSNFDSHGVSLRSSDFFTAAELNQIRANPSAITAIFANNKADFLKALGSSFAGLPDREIRLAFAAVLAHELGSFNSAAPDVYDLPMLLSAGSLNTDGLALLAWRLFQVLSPDTNSASQAGNPDVSQIGWSGGAIGRTAQLLVNVQGAPSLLVDPTTGHVAIVSGLNQLLAGETVSITDQASFLTDASRISARDAMITTLHDGLYRTGNMFYWFSIPNDAEFFFESPNYDGGYYYNYQLGWGPQSFSTPQGESVLHGAPEAATIGSLASVDRLIAGPGGDTLIANGIVNNDGIWTTTSRGRYDWTVGDFDGDGRDDILRYVPGSSGGEVHLSNGSSFEHSGSWTGRGWGDRGWYVGDFNGDGRDDIFRYVAGSSGAEMFLSNGSSFTPSGSWTGKGSGTTDWYIGDFNGDGRDDLLRYLPGTSGANVLLSTGSGFKDAGSWTGAGFGKDGWYIGDFNGDGRSDLLRYLPGQSGGEVFLSTGTSFTRAGSWTGYGHGTLNWFVQDVNGDGKDDLVGNPFGSRAASVVLLSTGSGFTMTDAWAPQGVGMPTLDTGDFNGDGKADYLYTTASGSVVLTGNGIAQPEIDQIIFAPKTLHGATIAGFQNGVDQIWFEGFGDDATLTHGVGDSWSLSYTQSGIDFIETFRIINTASLSSDSYFFI